MGYKGTIRSLKAVANQSRRASAQRGNQVKRENERIQRQQLALQEKFTKKNASIKEKRGKALEKLNELYADGKINSVDFKQLKTRDSEISIDLVVFGKAAGLKLSERYVTGKINKNEFEDLKNEILGDVEAEKDDFTRVLQARLEETKVFVKKAKKCTDPNVCNSCGKPRKFFTPLYNLEGLNLCGNCLKTFSTLRNYPGRSGVYYNLEPITLSVDGSNEAHMGIRSEYILSF